MLSKKKRTKKLIKNTTESFIDHANNLDLDYYEGGMYLHDGGTIPESRKEQIYARAKEIASGFPFPWNNFYTKNIDLALRETAAQLNDAAMIRRPVVDLVGEEFALLSLELYPKIQHTTTYKGKDDTDVQFAAGGLTQERKDELYSKWKQLVNMSASELKKFYDSEDGKAAGLSKTEASSHGIDYGRESARWIMKMKDTKRENWTADMWKWAGKQISFISRMRGNQGALFDDKGNKTRKHTSLLIWGHNPVKKMEEGGEIDKEKYRGHYTIKNPDGTFHTIKVMFTDEYLRPSDDFFTVQVKLRRKYAETGEVILSLKPAKTYPVQSFDSFMEDLQARGGKHIDEKEEESVPEEPEPKISLPDTECSEESLKRVLDMQGYELVRKNS